MFSIVRTSLYCGSPFVSKYRVNSMSEHGRYRAAALNVVPGMVNGLLQLRSSRGCWVDPVEVSFKHVQKVLNEI